ncbi:NADPH-dependent F420 reductase [Sorangium sp. So ce1151]|uniref:NADPH-dependent F420 reductase n=1 Tax=Sorangium sp. So ce1151 TaxID=3133332 RepID=UPI003F62AAB6
MKARAARTPRARKGSASGAPRSARRRGATPARARASVPQPPSPIWRRRTNGHVFPTKCHGRASRRLRECRSAPRTRARGSVWSDRSLEGSVNVKIGVIGTGNMGRTFGLLWASNGHDVLFGSRDRAKAEVVAAKHERARAGDFDDAAAFGDVILYTVRGAFPSTLLRAPQALAGKVVIDCNNRDFDSRIDRPTPEVSLAERLAADVPQAKIVTAFQTIPHVVAELGRDKLAPQRISVFLCSDDAAAKATVQGLVDELGLVGIDSGELKRARLLEAVGDFIRLHIGARGHGIYTSLSIRPVQR